MIDSDEDVSYFYSSDDESSTESEEASSSQRKNGKTEYPVEVLSTEDIVQYMKNCIEEVNTVVQMPAPILRNLLNYFQWDKQKLMDKYFDNGQDKMFQQAHILDSFTKMHVTTPSSPKESTSEDCSPNETKKCTKCNVSLTTMLTDLKCGHHFCTKCWIDYLEPKIMKQQILETMTCAVSTCNMLVDDTTVIKLVKSPQARSKYLRLLSNSVVKCNKLMKWCPNPNCGHAVKVQSIETKTVKCKCNHVFCFACGQDYHEPIDCNLLLRWFQETMNFPDPNATDITKKCCPSCNILLVKQSGCNYTKCSKCDCNFCWFCFVDWNAADHFDKKCNKFDKKKISQCEDGLCHEKETIERYYFYNKRYLIHKESLKHEKKLYEKMRKIMDKMQQQNMSWIDVQYLERAVDILQSCRQTLMSASALAYYLENNNQVTIFEDNQQVLEKATEELSGYLETDIDTEVITEIKHKLMNKYEYCEKRKQALLEHVQEGNDKDWWRYRI